MTHTPPAGFFAYPSQPTMLGETVRTAIDEVNRGSKASLTSWEECRVGGKLIIGEICTSIDSNEMFCADLTGLNPNVMFELGYAIAKNKRIWLILDSTLAGAKTQFEQLRILTTIGYAKYCSSPEIVTGFYKDQPYTDLQNTIFEQAIRANLAPTTGKKILYLKSLHDTDASIRITKRIYSLRSSETTIITDDPKESTVQSLTWYGVQAFAASGVLCHLTSPQRTGSQLHNARYALVSGMALGMGIPLLMLSEGDFLAPMDYRDLLGHYQTAAEAMGHLDVWLKEIEKTLYEHRASHLGYATSLRLATELKGLQFGESAAENESEELVNNYFVETVAYRDAFEGRHGIFVGRKGAGKTANLLKLNAELRKNKRNLVCVIKPVAYELQGIIELLKKYKTLDSKGYVIESLWKYLLYTEIAEAVAQDLRPAPTGMLDTDEKALLVLLQRESGKLSGEFSVRLERCVEALIRTKVADGTVEASRLAVSETLHQGEIGELRLLLGRLLSRKRRVAILIDNLDKAWDKQSNLDDLAQFLLGLLSAAGRVATDFKHEDSRRQAVSVSLAIFLRTDIFYQLLACAREPDKIIAFKLGWQDREILRRVVEERFLSSREGSILPEELWTNYFAPSVHGVATKEYFTERILQRPRDLLIFVKAAVAMAVNRGQPLVREKDILEAEKQYSQYALSSILVENGISLLQLESILYEFAGANACLGVQEVGNVLAKVKVRPEDHPRILDHLASISFLGIEVREDDFRFAEDPLDYRKNAVLSQRFAERQGRPPRFLIHPAFRAFLEISEP
jgi:hypothetical protein